jgi:hypothetical protein
MTAIIAQSPYEFLFCCRNMNYLKLGYWASLMAALAVVGYTISQFLQVNGQLTKPLDDILIYAFSLCIAPGFLLAVVALHDIMPVNRKAWSHAAVLFALMYNIFVIIMYAVQLGAVIPYHLDNPALIVGPHSFFWILDALGYIMMGIASVFLALALSRNGVERYAKWFLLAHGLFTPIVALVYFYPGFSIWLLLVESPWCITALGSLLSLAFLFKKTAPRVEFNVYQQVRSTNCSCLLKTG